MKKGTSSKPLIFGILGLITALPNALITLLSSSLIMDLNDPGETSMELPFFYMKMVFWSAIVGFSASLFAKRFYKTAGFVLLVSGTLIFISMITGNLFLIFPSIFFVLAGVLCFTQSKVNSKSISNQTI